MTESAYPRVQSIAFAEHENETDFYLDEPYSHIKKLDLELVEKIMSIMVNHNQEESAR